MALRSAASESHIDDTQPPDSQLAAVVIPSEDPAATLRSASTSEASHNKVNGTDRGTFIIEQGAYPIQNATRGKDQNGLGVAGPDDPMYTLDNASQHAVSFVQRGRPEPQAEAATEISPALRPALGGSSHVNVAYSFQERTRGHQPNLEFIEEQAYALLNPGNGSRQQERNVAYASLPTSSRVITGDLAPTLQAQTSEGRGGVHGPALLTPQYRVRRLTPTETLRLQGFPDDHLDLAPPLSDTAKYRMVGNAVCANVTEWLAKRLAAVLQRPQ